MRSVGIAQHPLDFDQEIVSYQIGISSENTNNKECSPEKQWKEKRIIIEYSLISMS